MMDLSADNAVFFSTADFGLTAQFSHAEGAAVAVKGQFLDKYEAMRIFGLEVESSAPVFVCATADIPTATPNDTLVIVGATYYIQVLQHDGTGITLLLLSKDPVQ